MNLNYPKDSKVVITAIGKHKVGYVVDRAISEDGIVHTIQTEDGKIYDDVTELTTSPIFINEKLTNIFLKSK